MPSRRKEEKDCYAKPHDWPTLATQPVPGRHGPLLVKVVPPTSNGLSEAVAEASASSLIESGARASRSRLMRLGRDRQHDRLELYGIIDEATTSDIGHIFKKEV